MPDGMEVEINGPRFPWLLVAQVGFASEIRLDFLDALGGTADAPAPIGAVVGGTIMTPDGGATTARIGLVLDVNTAGCLIDAIRAAADSKGVGVALTAATDQANAVRKARTPFRDDTESDPGKA